jgi:hypothetical protein
MCIEPSDRRCLVIRIPDRHRGPACQGKIGDCRQLAPRGCQYDGREGVRGTGANEERTGYYCPVEWLDPIDAAMALSASEWESECNGEWTELREWLRIVEEQYAGRPEDWPGLREHYPEMVE